MNILVQAVDVQAMLSETIASNGCETTAGKRGFGETCEKKRLRLLYDNASAMHLPMS